MTHVDRLINLGYELTAKGDSINCHWQGNGSPPESARELLAGLKAHKDEALAYLRSNHGCNPPKDVVAEHPILTVFTKQIGDTWPIILEDYERPGWFTAHKKSNREVVGRGPNAYAALGDLKRRETAE